MNIDRQKINSISDKIRQALSLNTPPYDPLKAIELLKGNVLYDITDNNMDAYIEKHDNNSFIIHLNPSKPDSRERFTVAHEIGHLFLHMGYLINTTQWNSDNLQFNDSVFYRTDNNYSILEYEANEFAAAFLMPKDEFISVAERNLNNNKYTIDPIADYFGVSIIAAKNRGKWIGIFQW
jgi:Zn-dependent peptidase ImmA (M78 family)